MKAPVILTHYQIIHLTVGQDLFGTSVTAEGFTSKWVTQKTDDTLVKLIRGGQGNAA